VKEKIARNDESNDYKAKEMTSKKIQRSFRMVIFKIINSGTDAKNHR